MRAIRSMALVSRPSRGEYRAAVLLLVGMLATLNILWFLRTLAWPAAAVAVVQLCIILTVALRWRFASLPVRAWAALLCLGSIAYGVSVAAGLVAAGLDDDIATTLVDELSFWRLLRFVVQLIAGLWVFGNAGLLESRRAAGRPTENSVR